MTAKTRISEKGFTLTELLVAMVISGIVLAAIYSAYMSQQKAYSVTEAVTDPQQNLRAAMYLLEREVRMAGYDPRSTGDFGFTAMNATDMTFTWDENEDGSATETIAYQYDAANNALQRNVNGGGFFDTALYISGVTFQYLDASGNPTATASAVRFVDIGLEATRDTHTRRWNARVECRNLGL